MNMKYLEFPKPILESLPQMEILLAEIAEPGAMGYSGEIHVYALIDKTVMTYHGSIAENQDEYDQVTSWFNENSDLHKRFIMPRIANTSNSKLNPNMNVQRLFNCLYGGFGNHVYFKKDIIYRLENGEFLIPFNDQTYSIKISVNGIYMYLEENYFI